MSGLNTFMSTATVDEVAASIGQEGYAIVHDVLDRAALARLEGEIAPYIEAAPFTGSEFAGEKNKRFGALLAKLPMTREMVVHPLAEGVARQVLGLSCARIQLNFTNVLHLGPGQEAQIMHRDTGFYPIQNPCPPLLLATIWAVDDFTCDNGATCLVPGSHRWEDGRKPRPEEIVQAEMPAGSLLMYIGAVLHGGGANRTDTPRTGVALHYSLSWLRQEENQYLAVPPALARTFPQEVQALMGYDLGTVNLGFVDRQHPLDYLNGVGDAGPRELGPEALMAADNAIERFRVNDTAVVGRARYSVVADEFPEVGPPRSSVPESR